MGLKKIQNDPLDLRPAEDSGEDKKVNDESAEAGVRNAKAERRRVDLEKIKQDWLARHEAERSKNQENKKAEVNKHETEKYRKIGYVDYVEGEGRDELVEQVLGKRKEFQKQEIKKAKKQEDRKLERDNNIIEKEADEMKIPAGEYKFPDGFLWGTSTSAYQVEGGIKNDWSEWERSLPRLQRLMREGKKSSDYICDKACDAYNRYEEDLDLSVDLNNNAVRFGIEWARIQPKKDTWDIEAVKHYRRVLSAAKERGLTTVVTLWHWTIPSWLAEENGWENKQAIEYFKEYVALVVDELGADIDYWVTLNEPMLLANYGYLLGKFPPRKHNYFKFRKVSKNLMAAHKAAYKIIHKHFPKAQVSITNLSNIFEPYRKWFLGGLVLTLLARSYGLNKFYNNIKEYIDYIGIDYYRKIYIKVLPPFMGVKSKKLTDMGWEIYPEGIYHVVKQLSKYKKPMLILENGLADAEDKYRADSIREHLYWVHKAIAEGADVRGYFYWSLLDNFEWDKGYDPKFGLYAVDRRTFERTARPSVEVYAEICKNNKLII